MMNFKEYFQEEIQTGGMATTKSGERVQVIRIIGDKAVVKNFTGARKTWKVSVGDLKPTTSKAKPKDWKATRLKEYTEKEALKSGGKVLSQAANLVKKYGKKAMNQTDDPAVKAAVKRKLYQLIPPAKWRDPD